MGSAPLLRLDPLRDVGVVRLHCMLESKQFPQGSSRSHLTFLVLQVSQTASDIMLLDCL